LAPISKQRATTVARYRLPCRIDKETGGLVVTGPPAGLFSIGGYRFAMREVQKVDLAGRQGGEVPPLPDTFAGHSSRAIARTARPCGIRSTAVGLNPLIVRAFRDRTGTPVGRLISAISLRALTGR
jgi:hypothetical protein